MATRTCCVVTSRGWCISSSTGPRGITISSPCTFNLIWNRSKDVLINSIEKEFYKLKPVLCTHSIHSNEKFRSSSYKLTVNNPTRSWDFQIPLSPVSERNRNPNRKIRKPHWKPNPKPIRPKTKCWRTENPQSVINAQSEKPKFFGTKTDLKKISKIPMPPSRMNRSVQSTNHTSDNTTNIIITETLTTTFLSLLFSNQKHAAKQL